MEEIDTKPAAAKPATRAWMHMVLMMGFLPIIGSTMDYATTVQGAFGRTQNLSLLWVIAFVALFAVNMKHLRRSADWIAMIVGMCTGIAIFLRTEMAEEAGFHEIVGAAIIALVIPAGFLAYALALRGADVMGTLRSSLMITAIGLPLAPLMVALRPEAYDPYYLSVYGYNSVRVLGYLAAAATVAYAMGISYAEENAWVRAPNTWLRGAGLVLAASCLAWSGSRAGMLATALAIVFVWLAVKWPGWGRATTVVVAGAKGIALSLLYPVPDREFGILSRIAKTVHGIDEANLRILTSKRSELWPWVLDRIAEAPWTGHGFYPMAHLRTEEFNFMHSHNLFLELALGMGVPFAIVATVALAALGFRAWQGARRLAGTPLAANALAAFAILVLFVIYAQMTAALFFPWNQLVFLIALGGLVGAENARRRS